jgi:type II secretory pathway pseudopilin PulG
MMKLRTHKNEKRSRRGFTLLETLLAASLFMLFLGAAIVSLGPASRGCNLDQGAVRLESILRFARAEAANTGRRVRVAFTPDAQTTEPHNPVRVLWEPEPLDEPDVFQDLSNAKWELDGFGEQVSVERVRLLDARDIPPATDPDDPAALDEEESPITPADSTPITFNPDGSSDSAEIVLAGRDSDDARRVTVRVMGLTGHICREVTSDPNAEDGPEGHKRTQDSSLTVAE